MAQKKLSKAQVAKKREAELRKRQRKEQRQEEALKQAEENALLAEVAERATVLYLLHDGGVIGGLAEGRDGVAAIEWEADGNGKPSDFAVYTNLDEAVFEFLVWEDEASFARGGKVHIRAADETWEQRLASYRERFDEWHDARFGELGGQDMA